MKKNLVTLLGIALAVAILPTGLFYGLFINRLRSGAQKVVGPLVMVAARDLERGAPVGEQDVKPVSWGAAELPQGSLTSLDQLQGMRVIEPVRQNEVLTQARIANPKTGGGAGLGIPVGMRAASTHVVDSSGVVALLKPGHKVDVQLVTLASAPQTAELRTILQNIEVLRVDQNADGRGFPVVTLLVKPQEADALGLGDSTARIRLTLRNPLDTGAAAGVRQALAPLFQVGSSAR